MPDATDHETMLDEAKKTTAQRKETTKPVRATKPTEPARKRLTKAQRIEKDFFGDVLGEE